MSDINSPWKTLPVLAQPINLEGQNAFVNNVLLAAVSYTHLDVYKRQDLKNFWNFYLIWLISALFIGFAVMFNFSPGFYY